ncbi:unnamed protein product, partial [Prorocentrum cordatum]
TVVNLNDAGFSRLLNSKDTKDCYPEPPGTIADCANLSNQQLFDVTALVKSASPFRPVGRSGDAMRVVFNVEIIDGSKSGDRARTMPLNVFTDQATTPDAGGKFDEWVTRDFSTELATETTRALYKAIANTVVTGVEVLDNAKETSWQLNWARVEDPPAGANIRTNDGRGLWFPVTVRDCAGTLTLCIQEAAALKPSGFDNADDFEAALAASVNAIFGGDASAEAALQSVLEKIGRDFLPVALSDGRFEAAALQHVAEKLEDFLRAVEEQRANHMRRAPGLDSDAIYAPRHMKEIQKKWMKDY